MPTPMRKPHLAFEVLEDRALLACTSLPNGIVSCWSADGNALDSVSGNHGSLQNGATFDVGQAQDAFSLDGIDDYVDMGNDPSLDITGSLTLAAWFYLDTLPSETSLCCDEAIISKWDFSSEVSYVLNLDRQSGDKFQLVIATTSGVVSVETSASVSTGRWYHYVGVVDQIAAELRIYVDGVLAAEKVYSGSNVRTSSENVTVGRVRDFGVPKNHFDGLIDEVQIYNRALTTTEITGLFNASDNVAPVVTLTGPLSADEGQTKTYSYTTSDPGDDTFSLVSQSCGAKGTLSNATFDSTSGAGSFDCTFPDGPASSDVSVQVADSDGAGSNVATVTVTVVPVNDAPIANDDVYGTDEDIILTISSPGLLANDTDIDGDPFETQFVAGPSNGALVLNADGSFSYTPNTGFTGVDTFTYRVKESTAPVWTSVGLTGLHVRSLAISPTWPADPTLLVGSSNYPAGFYRTTDGGMNWVSTIPQGSSSNMEFTTIALSPDFSYGGADETVFLGGTNQTWVFRSLNSGDSWSRSFSGVSTGDRNTWDFAVSPDYASDRTVYVVGNNKIHRSIDGGDTWQQIGDSLPGGSHMAVEISPNFAADQTIFDGTLNHGVFKSIDGGNNWTEANYGLPKSPAYAGPGIRSLLISPDYENDQTLFAGVEGVGMFRSTDGGNSWTPFSVAVTGFSPDYANDQTMFGAASTGILISKDEGNTWFPLPNTGLSAGASPPGSVRVSPQFSVDRTIFTGTRDGVWKMVVEREALQSNVATVTITVTARNDSPSVATDNTLMTVDEGAVATNTGVFNDQDDNDVVTISASVGTITQAGDQNGTWSWWYDTSDGPDDSQTVTITATDSEGVVNTTTFELEVNNVAPAVTLTGPLSADEGQTKSYSFMTSDPGNDTFSLVSQGCGANGTLSNTTFDSTTGAGSFDCTFPDGPASSDVTVQVADSDPANSNLDTLTVTVANVAPTDVVIDPLVSEYVFAVGEVRTFSTAHDFIDAGTLDTHTAEWSFSHIVDEAPVQETRAGTVLQGAGSGSVSDEFSFSGPGVYTVILTVTDDDGGATPSDPLIFVVYDPSEGFVTGGGWIDSPVGAYTADPTLAGRANFGFVSKYKNGATTPTGQTEFQFQVADFNFHSSNYEWLVVAGARAQYKGTGTVNGSGDYGFLLTAIDGQINGGGGADKFRIKVWDKNNNDAIVYDNQIGDDDDAPLNTLLNGGKIIIHSNGAKAAVRVKDGSTTGAGSEKGSGIDRLVGSGKPQFRTVDAAFAALDTPLGRIAQARNAARSAHLRPGDSLETQKPSPWYLERSSKTRASAIDAALAALAKQIRTEASASSGSDRLVTDLHLGLDYAINYDAAIARMRR